MDGLKIYAQDLAAEVRRVPSLLMVALALLLFALSTSSEVVTDARAALMDELRSGWAAMQAASGGQDVRRVRWSFGETAWDDMDLQ